MPLWVGAQDKVAEVYGVGNLFDSDSAPASAAYTPTPLRRTFKFWTPTPA